MYKELNISETEGVLAAFNAVCDLKEETERLQASCAAKEAELAGLRAQTSELFGARLEAEGADVDAVSAAKAMWQHDPQSVARATLGCDFAEAANPWGCNQYGHRKGHSGGVGGSDAKNSEARSNLSDSDADFLTSDAYEIAMEEGGYEILYDTPKERVKKAIRDTLKETGSASMLEEDTSALYSWWKKNKEKVVNKLKSESLQASNKHACEQESEQYSAEYYDALECSHTLEELLEDEEVAAANPYGCNQYGHGFREPHGSAGGRGQKTFDFFDDAQDQKVVREQREIKKRFEDASNEVKKAYKDSREKAKELNRFHEETERRNNGRAWTEEEREHEKKLEDELMKADERSKTARRKQLEAARKAGKKVVPDFSDDDLGFIDDKLYDEFKDVFDDDEVKSSRTLEEMLDGAESAKA